MKWAKNLVKKVLMAINIFFIILLLSVMLPVLFLVNVEDNVTLMFSNRRFEGFDINGDRTFAGASIRVGDKGYEWVGNGLDFNLAVANLTEISLCEGVSMWVNDSRGHFNFPTISDQNNEDFSVRFSDLAIELSMNGNNSLINPLSKGIKDVTYAYLNLDDIEASFGIHGNGTYRLLVSVNADYKIKTTTSPLQTVTPNVIFGHQHVALGYVDVSYVNGNRTFAHVYFPYKQFNFTINTPLIWF